MQTRIQIGSAGLLGDVGEFMGQELLSCGRLRCVLAGGENYVIASRVGQGVDAAGGLGRSSVGVNPNSGKIKTKAWLKKRPGSPI